MPVEDLTLALPLRVDASWQAPLLFHVGIDGLSHDCTMLSKDTIRKTVTRDSGFPSDFWIFLLIVCGVPYSMFVKLKRRPLTSFITAAPPFSVLC